MEQSAESTARRAPGPGEREPARPPLLRLSSAVAVVLLIAAIASLLVVDKLSPPRRLYETEVYRTEILRTPHGARVVEDEDGRQAEIKALQPGGDVLNISTEVAIVKAIPLETKQDGSGVGQPSARAISHAWKDYGVRVSLFAMSARPPFKMYRWPKGAKPANDSKLKELGVTFEELPESIVKEVLPLVAADAAAQSGNAALEAIIKEGGSPAPRLGWWWRAGKRAWVQMGAIGVALVLLVATRLLGRTRGPAA